MRSGIVRSGIVLCIALTLAASSASAEVLTFTIDDTQSSYQGALMDGLFVTTLSSPQTEGSDQTSLFGTFDVDLTATSIEFLSTGNIHPADQAVPQAPLIDGSAGTAPAQIGLNINVEDLGGGVAALRNYVADISSSPIPRTGGSFDSRLVFLAVSGGTTSFNLVILGDPLIDSYMGGNPGYNLLSGGSLTRAGDIYTLVMPYLVQNIEQVSGADVGLVHSGTLVATAVVPEPSGWLLAAAGVVALAGCSRKSRRIQQA